MEREAPYGGAIEHGDWPASRSVTDTRIVFLGSLSESTVPFSRSSRGTSRERQQQQFGEEMVDVVVEWRGDEMISLPLAVLGNARGSGLWTHAEFSSLDIPARALLFLPCGILNPHSITYIL